MRPTIRYRKLTKYLFLFVAICLGTWLFKGHKQIKTEPRDYAAIKKSGILRVAIEYNKLSYFVDSDSIAGFNYELVKAFAHDMKLKLDIHPVMSEKERIEGIQDGTFDLLACNLPSTTELKDSLLLSSPILLNKQILVQRKTGTKKAPYIKSQLDLARKTIHIPDASPAILRIRNLSNEIGDTIYIKEIKRYGGEQLLYMVEHKDIDYAVCDENIAKEYAPRLKDIDIQMAVSFTQFYSWGMNKKSPVLLKQLNAWVKHFKGTTKYQQIYQKYIENPNRKKQ